MLHFLLNQEPIAVADAHAELTILEWLRVHRRKCGTKEGCASGDCGACTVVVATVENDALAYRAINSCIAFVGSLHAKQLITVEDLAAREDGKLHAVQQAMLEQHGSQCGFCTPGFIMSMFALYKNHPQATRHTIAQSLGGNLCRCTGYRPIMDAALQATRQATDDQFSAQAEACVKKLKALQPRQPANANDNSARFHRPTSAQQLATLMQQNPHARLLAGGTDLALEVTQQLNSITPIIFLGEVTELRHTHTHTHENTHAATNLATTDEKPHEHEIGAAVPLADCGALLCAEYPDLAELLSRFGSAQIRNQATLGGNIANASPIADLPPALIAVGARLVLQQGARLRRLAVEDYFLDYHKTALAQGEFIRSVLLPGAQAGRSPTRQTSAQPLHANAPTQKIRAYKISKRFDDDISTLCAVFNVTLQDEVIVAVRTGFGGLAAIPKRAHHCEQALLGNPLNRRTVQQAQRALNEDFQPISDARASAAYRMTVAQNLLQRLANELTAGEQLENQPPSRISAAIAAAAAC